MNVVHLKKAILCLDCEYIHDSGDSRGETCPVCGGQALWHVSRWIISLLEDAQAHLSKPVRGVPEKMQACR